jgi:hypothetical protein
MKTIYIESLAAARNKMKELVHVKVAILFRNLNEKPIAAWVPNGREGGEFITQSDIKKRPNMPMPHNFLGNQDAFYVVRDAALKSKQNPLKSDS